MLAVVAACFLILPLLPRSRVQLVACFFFCLTISQRVHSMALLLSAYCVLRLLLLLFVYRLFFCFLPSAESLQVICCFVACVSFCRCGFCRLCFLRFALLPSAVVVFCALNLQVGKGWLPPPHRSEAKRLYSSESFPGRSCDLEHCVC